MLKKKTQNQKNPKTLVAIMYPKTLKQLYHFIKNKLIVNMRNAFYCFLCDSKYSVNDKHIVTEHI